MVIATLSLAVLFVASACNQAEQTKIGACPIKPGSLCAGNYMRGAKLVNAELFDADLHLADLTAADLSASDLSGATLQGAPSSGRTSTTRTSATPTSVALTSGTPIWSAPTSPGPTSPGPSDVAATTRDRVHLCRTDDAERDDREPGVLIDSTDPSGGGSVRSTRSGAGIDVRPSGSSSFEPTTNTVVAYRHPRMMSIT